jgi:hypothetical protein
MHQAMGSAGDQRLRRHDRKRGTGHHSRIDLPLYALALLCGGLVEMVANWVIIIAIVVVCAGNLDSIAIARALYTGGAVRAAVVQQASDQNFCSTPDDQARCAVEARSVLESTGIQLGWSTPKSARRDLGLALKVLGLLLSIGAATLGAPFWYRFLDRVGTLRNTGRPPSPGS